MRARNIHVHLHAFVVIRFLGVCRRTVDWAYCAYAVDGKPVGAVADKSAIASVETHEVDMSVAFRAVVDAVPVCEASDQWAWVFCERVYVETVVDDGGCLEASGKPSS